jgi:hypothetical protein
VEADRVVRCCGADILWTVGSYMAVTLSALRTGSRFGPHKYYFLLLVLITVTLE